MKKTILIFCLLFTTALSAAEFDEAFDMSAKGFSRQANRIVSYIKSSTSLDVSQQKNEFDFISDSLSKMESELKSNPVYWFVRGLHAKNLASFYQQSGATGQVDKMMKDKNKFYLLAMDKDKKYEPHLSARAYAEIKSALSGAAKQQAIEAELKLGGSGENESYYWYLHWSNVNELQKQGRLEEAEDALDKMKSELSAGDQQDTFNVLVNKIDNELKNMKRQKSSVHSKQTAAKDSKPVVKDKAGNQGYPYFIMIAGIMLVIIIIVVMFELRRRKK